MSNNDIILDYVSIVSLQWSFFHGGKIILKFTLLLF